MIADAQEIRLVWNVSQLPDEFSHLAAGAKLVAKALLNARLLDYPRDEAIKATVADLLRGGFYRAH